MQNELKSESWRKRDIFYGLVVYLVFLIAFLLWESMLGYALFGETFEESELPIWIDFLEDLIGSIIFAGIPLYFIIVRYGESLSAIGLHTSGITKKILIGLFGGFLIWLISIPIDLGTVYLIGEGPITHPLDTIMKETPDLIDYVYVFLTACALAPIAEEIFFRGFAYGILKRHYTKLIAVVVTNILFWSLHISPWWFIQIFFIGVGLTLLYEYTRSMVVAIVAHSTLNLLYFLGFIILGYGL